MKSILLILVFLASCSQDEDTFVLIVYPDKNNLDNHISVEVFDTLEQCRTSAENIISINKYENADYECGINCRKIYDSSMYICKESIR